MQTGAVTNYIDVAQLVLYAFWIFFAGLILYLRREDKREGYPLSADFVDRSTRIVRQGFPAMPEPKTYLLANGKTVSAPKPEEDAREIKAAPIGPWPGAPLVPTGDPMRDGVGPAAYAMRADTPDLTLEGQPRIVPMRVAGDFSVADGDPDPRGLAVVDATGEVAGTVKDIWVDRSEITIRFLELDVAGASRHALLPMNFARVDGRHGKVKVYSILAGQFAHVPGTASADRITLLEEEKIMAYFGGGGLYAEPSRQEPLL
jgi:photosynthetic reaction center H subunit